MIVCVQLLTWTILLYVIKVEHAEATKHDIMPVESIEDYMRKRKSRESNLEVPVPRSTYEDEKNVYPKVRVLQKHKKKKSTKHKRTKHVNQKKETKTDKVKKIHQPNNKHGANKQVPKWVKDLDKDSNASGSREIGRSKPVDIIVHIKMNE